MRDRTEQLTEQLNTELEKIKAKTVEPTDDIDQEEEVNDPYLDEAVKMGYDPAYKGNNKKSPEQFVKDGSFFRKIDSQNKKIDELTNLVKESVEHGKKLEQAGYEKALKDIENAKLRAVSNGDVTAYKTAELQRDIVIERMKTTVPAPTTVPVENSAAVKAFQEKHNDWLAGTSKEDKKMQAFLKSKIVYFQDLDPNYDENDAIKEIEDDLMYKFPERFGNVEQSKPAVVGRSTASRAKTKNSELAERLTDRQKKFLRDAQRYGSKLTLDEYANQLSKTGELRDE